MGLRFRKSISLCKGVRLNVGKTGVSISAGIPGFRKTIHSSGRVTTTVGIPGSGLYYVDTDHIGKKKNRATNNQTETPMPKTVPQHQVPTTTQQWVPRPSFVTPNTRTNTPTPPSNTSFQPTQSSVPPKPPAAEILVPVVEPSTLLHASDEQKPSFTELFENCDLPVNWIDVLTNREPISIDYDAKTWGYLHSKAASVFEGNVEVMLQIIDEVSPFDDLHIYASNFSVEMEDPAELTIEFSVEKDVAPRSELQDAVCSVVIRVARDAFALLPIDCVTIHTMLNGETIISARLRRCTFATLDFGGKDPSELLKSVDVNMTYLPVLGFRAVARLD